MGSAASASEEDALKAGYSAAEVKAFQSFHLPFNKVAEVEFESPYSRGRAFLHLKDQADKYRPVFLLLLRRFAPAAGELGVAGFVNCCKELAIVGDDGLDEDSARSQFFEVTGYPEDEDDEEMCAAKKMTAGGLAAGLLRVHNLRKMMEKGSVDVGLAEQLSECLEAAVPHLAVPELVLPPRCLGRADELFQPPLGWAKSGPRIAFLEVIIDTSTAGRIEIALDCAKVPRTTYNFAMLCTGERGFGELTGKRLHYKGSLFHRISNGTCVQGGDIENAAGAGGESIWGGEFEDEALDGVHGVGTVSMANKGQHTNSSQFFFCTSEEAAAEMDGEHVVFGKVVKGIEVLNKIECVEVDEEADDLPKVDCRITECGLLPVL